MNGYSLKIPGIAIRKAAEKSVESDKSDNALVSQTLDGKVRSFQTLVERYRKNAYLYAAGMVGNQDDAYDLSQEAFVRAYKNLNRFNPVYQFKTWFFHILSNICKNYLRQRTNRSGVVTSTELTSVAVAPRTARPDVLFEADVRKKAIWDCINGLPEKFREIIILCHFQDMSYEQIAGILDIPRGSVMSRLYYARVKLREIFEQRGIEL